MKVVFRTNLGSVDAKKFDLDHTKCTVGKSVDVHKDVADELLKMGVVETPDKAEDDALVQSALEEEQRQKDLKNPAIKAPAKEPAIKAPTPDTFAKNPRADDK